LDHACDFVRFVQEKIMSFRQMLIATLAVLVAGAGWQVQAAIKVDPALAKYQKVRGVSGNLSSVGSDTLANLMTLWAEEFKRNYPNINIQVQASGSSTAPPALAEGTSNIGPMSRKMKDNEAQAFEQRHGYPATAIPVAIDALAVYVHKDNPISGLSMEQVDALFSSNRTCGGVGDISNWGQLGLTGSWQRRNIQLFGRNSVSGTYGYFKEKALCKGDYKNTVNEQPGSASVVQSIATSISAIGYSGIGYRTASVRSVPLSENGDYTDATPQNAVTGAYPLSRFLYIYVNKAPNMPLPHLEGEFIKMVLSRNGQQVVVKDGYVPLPAVVAEQQLEALGL
jgi:phosphate transport system substrate-binding protein